MLVLIWSVVILAVLWLYLRQVYSRFSKHGVKHFKPLPLLGNSAKSLFNMEHVTETFEKLHNAFPEERFVGLYDFITPTIQVRDLELIKKIGVKDFESFLNHKFVIHEDGDPLFGKNIFFLNDQKWKEMRATLSPAFTSSKIRLMVPFMVEIAEQMISSVKMKIEASGNEYVDIDSRDLLTRYANDVIASCAFGLKVDSQSGNNNFYEMGKVVSDFTFIQIIKFLGFFICPNIMKKLKICFFPEYVHNFFMKLVMGTMQDRENLKIIRNDLIQLLMEAKRGQLMHDDKANDSNAGFATVEESTIGKKQINRKWSDEDLVAQAVLFFIAGFDSISTMLVFLMYELAVNPEVQDKLTREIKEDWEKNDGNISYKSIQEMVYMDMVISELLRLWPSPVADRTCTKDYNLGKPNKDATEDYIIRKGESILLPIWPIHRSPEYYTDPLKFDPERFSEKNKHNIKPFTYLPFGIGPRNCLGKIPEFIQRFALCEIKIAAYMLLLHIEVSPAEKTKIPVELKKNEGFNLRMKDGHWIRIKIRI